MKKYQIKSETISTIHEPAEAYQAMRKNFSNIIGIDRDNNHKYLHLVKTGIDASVLQDFMKISQIHIDLMADILHLNNRTLRRIKEHDTLNTHISEKLVELIRLYKLGHEIFGDVFVFNTWMDSKIRGLGFLRPLDIVDTSIGIDIVTEELQRIVYGIHG